MPINLHNWDVEDEQFWESEGKKIANRNLWISIPSLLCGFAVWLYWGIITVQMINLGYPFSQSQLFTLSAIAGLTGATLRIPSSFLIRIAGGRNTIFFTTALLMIPAIGTASPCRTRRRRSKSTTCSPCSPASAAATSPPQCRISASSSRSGSRGPRWG